jgi:pyruvate-formate lyase-activating enzyme
VDGPGNRFVVFLQGCNFDCLACHNPDTIGCRPAPTSRWVDVDELVEEVRAAAPFVSGVTVSGGEATVQWAFVRSLFRALAADPELARLGRLVDTNGAAPTAVWDELAPLMDGAMVDLKAIDPDVHAFLTGHPNDHVLASIEHLARLGKLHEVRLLLVPAVNDRPDHLAATATWLRSVAPDVRVRLLGFRRAGTRDSAEPFREATASDLEAARATLVAHGLRADHVTCTPIPHDP